MNLFEEYMTLRRKHGLPASQALKGAKSRAVHQWKVALRGWDFNTEIIRTNMSDRETLLYRTQIGEGRELRVYGAYDRDSDLLDGYCTTSYRHTEDRHTNQMVISHEDGTYWVWTGSDWARARFSDRLDTKHFRAQGYAKQPAFEKAVESRRSQVEYVERCLQGDVYVGFFKVVIATCPGALAEDEDDDDAGEVLAESDGCGGVEYEDDAYFLEFLNEQYEEAVSSLTR